MELKDDVNFAKGSFIMSKGFVTVASGDEFYYKLAENLLKSYRFKCGRDYNFAIICDRKNKYTENFDDVVVLNDLELNYTDKLRILTDCPYDENIFIESDCLIYNDINVFWDIFKQVSDLSTFGWNDGNIEAWFGNDSIKAIVGREKIPIFCPGYIYIKNGELCQKMFCDAIEIINYLYRDRENNPKCFVKNTLRDDPVFCAIMAKNDCYCAAKPKIGKCINFPAENKKITARISRGKLNYAGGKKGGNLLHFSSAITKEGLYTHQIFILNAAINKKWYAKILDTFPVYCVFIIGSLIRNRSYRELSRSVKKFIRGHKK